LKLVIGGSIVVEHLTHKPMIEGLNPAFGIGREKIAKKVMAVETGAETIDIREYIDCSLAWPAGLVLVEKLCHSHYLAGAPQSVAKQIFIVLLTT
jgi:hypothetical protein